MRRKWRRAKPKPKKFFRSNNFINSAEVFLIDETGETLGTMSTAKAQQMSRELGLDLVEVDPKANPPVVKIIDLGKLKYERDKRAHKQKLQQKKVEIKGIRLSVRIGKNDFDLRLKQGIKFLEKGKKLKIDLVLKGREKQHPEKAREIINEFVKKLEQTENFNIIREQDLARQGGRFNMVIMNKT
ncbi:MAG: translation initiation factor IF-3 [Patescibacteria group bacterium]|nr:translation initiation factor IF-3 [Patescibacteria group bacterium]